MILRTIVIAISVFALDQLSKFLLIDFMASLSARYYEMTSWFNLVMVWNYGVSFGMFSAHDARWFLIFASLAICIMLGIWSAKTRNPLQAYAYGLVIGGALGNVCDRIMHGAVADFFDLHIMGHHWPAFNVADMAVVTGVTMLLWCELRKGKAAE